jgi:hypothetical protein
MHDRSRYALVVILIAVVLVVASAALGYRLVRGDSSILRNVSVSETAISPNADGEQDITLIAYELSRNADVSIYLEDEAGNRYYFRREKPRGEGEYQVFFSGVVEGYSLPDDTTEGEILARLLPDGVYTWMVEAVDENGNTEQVEGELTIMDADPQLPDLRNFTLDRTLFTPNRDGINDRVLAQVWLEKEANMRVYLETVDGRELPIPELDRGVPPGLPGRHFYDYAGGVDENATPPPDGTYTIVALAEDEEGQRVQVKNEIVIELGGVPRAEIVSPPTGDTFALNATSLVICDTLFFTVTVENYGDTPIRTSGPEPGLLYDSNWNATTVGWPTESGAWRLGVGYENALSDYPYRWGLGHRESLTEIDGHYYLMPGARSVITGGIRLVDELGVRNPQPMWVGLIHEDVEISQFNNRVDPHEVLIELPDPQGDFSCPPRDPAAAANPKESLP